MISSLTIYIQKRIYLQSQLISTCNSLRKRSVLAAGEDRLLELVDRSAQLLTSATRSHWQILCISEQRGSAANVKGVLNKWVRRGRFILQAVLDIPSMKWTARIYYYKRALKALSKPRLLVLPRQRFDFEIPFVLLSSKVVTSISPVS